MMKKMKSLKTVTFVSHEGDSDFDWVDPCNCCGARVTKSPNENTDPTRNEWGIRFIAGKVGEEIETDKIQVKHIESRNGTFTLSLKYEFAKYYPG